MRHPLFLVFLPWIFFSVVYGTTPGSLFFASVGAAALMLMLNIKELKKGFILPWSSLLIFLIVAFNDRLHFSLWLESHALMSLNLALAAIAWLSLLIARPFTLQYARLEVEPLYWNSPSFKSVNWILTGVWALLLTLMALPGLFLSPAQIMDSWFWNYGLSVLCILLGLKLTRIIPGWYRGRMFWSKVKHLPKVRSPYLEGGFAPVRDEVTLSELKVEGSLPLHLNGTYLRNGPNPLFSPYTYTYPMDGDGMIHAMDLSHGWATYKNRFVKTKAYLAEKKAGKALYGGVRLPLPPDPRYVQDGPIKNTASVHIAALGNQLLALYEASPAYKLDKELNTLGEWNPNAQGTSFNINAHHRKDPKTGHIYACTYNPEAAPYLIFYEFDKDMRLLKSIPIDKPRATMIHDFVITDNYIVFFDAPAIFDFKAIKQKKEFLSYDAEAPLYVYIIRRHTHEITKIETDSFFVYHFVNAYEKENKIIIDFVHHDALMLDPLLNEQKGRGPRLYHAEIDLHRFTYQHYCQTDMLVEFPAYNLKLTGQAYRYAYLCAKTSIDVQYFDAILKYDFVLSQGQLFRFPPGVEVDEALFVPDEKAKAEDEGYLMLFAYDKNNKTSDFLVLNAKEPKENPISIIKLGRRVPHGLHGSWLPRSK